MAERTVMTVIREIATVKAQVKDLTVQRALLVPLEAELAARADAIARQLSLPIEEAAGKPKK